MGTEELFFVFPFVISVICFQKIAAAESVISETCSSPSFCGSLAFSPAVVICLEDAERKAKQICMYSVCMHCCDLIGPLRCLHSSTVYYTLRICRVEVFGLRWQPCWLCLCQYFRLVKNDGMHPRPPFGLSGRIDLSGLSEYQNSSLGGPKLASCLSRASRLHPVERFLPRQLVLLSQP